MYFDYAIVCVAVCCFLFIIFKLSRLYEPFGSSVVVVKNHPLEELLKKVDLPFSLDLGKVHSVNGLQYELISTSHIPCLFAVCHNVSIELANSLINQPWLQFRDQLELEATKWPNLKVYEYENPHKSKLYSIEYPSLRENRSNYAVVTFQLINHDKFNNDFNSNMAVAIITLIHLPDEHCKNPASKLAQYLKFSNGRILNLKPLYSSKREVSNDNNEDCNSNCTVCWLSSASCVLLPCRHCCICETCLKRICNCPICRQPVTSYFLTD